MRKAVLFDLDGVLIDSEPVYARCLSLAFAQAGCPIPPEELYPLAGMEFRMKFETVIRARGLSLTPEELTAPYRSIQAAALQDFGPLLKPGAVQVLERLRTEGYRLALCSNSSRERVAQVFRDTGLEGRFDRVFTGEDVPRRKPDPGVYLLALETLGLAPEECLAVEDSVYGIQAAKGAGLTVAALRDGRFPYREGSADFEMTGLARLHPILEGFL